MPATAISEQIALVDPAGGFLVVVRDDREGKVTLAVQIGSRLNTLKLDATGWRGLSHALGVPPAADFVPVVRHCRVCFKCEPEVTTWVAANLCSTCLHKPIATRGVVKGGRG